MLQKISFITSKTTYNFDKLLIEKFERIFMDLFYI